MSSELVLALLSKNPSELALSYRWAILRSALGNRILVRPLLNNGLPEEADFAAGGGVSVIDLPKGSPCLARLPVGETHCLIGSSSAPLRARCLFGVVEASRDILFPIVELGAIPGANGFATLVGLSSLNKVLTNKERFLLRLNLEEYNTRWLSDGICGATWLDIAIAEHQAAVVYEILKAPYVRHLLADEVGLGKTIEALMVWSALKAQSPKLRTLIVAPRHLIPQWCLEVRRRCEHRLRARRYEDVPPVFLADRGESALSAENPRGIIVTDPKSAASFEHALDLLIVDEAHELNQEGRETIKKLSNKALHVLLLTATPRDLQRVTGAARYKSSPFSWALSIVETSLERLSDEDREQAISESLALARELIGIQPEDISEEIVTRARQLATLLDKKPSEEALRSPKGIIRSATALSRVMSTRRSTLQGINLTERRLLRVNIEFREEELDIFKSLCDEDDEENTVATLQRLACSSWGALSSSRVGKSSKLLERLRNVRTLVIDSKLEALLDTCASIWKENSSAKIVIRCEYADTLQQVYSTLRSMIESGALRDTKPSELDAWKQENEEQVGPVARLTESQESMIDLLVDSKSKKGSMLAHLSAFEYQGEGGALVLVADDLGATGLNLQFATDLIFYDLPWRPLLTAQWIGRLDRLGRRSESVNIHVLTNDKIQTEPLLRIYEALGIFGRTSQIAPEMDERINSWIRKAEKGDTTWEEVERLVKKQIDSLTSGQDLEQHPLDLEPKPVEEKRASSITNELLETLKRFKFTVEKNAYKEFELRWPPSTSPDLIELRNVRQALRPQIRRGLSADKVLEVKEELKFLLLAERRLDTASRIRRSTIDFLSPHHPLISEATEELRLDPSLALGAFLISKQRTTLYPGLYLLAVTSNLPATGAHEALWRCFEGAAGTPEKKEKKREAQSLERILEMLSSGLSRSFSAALSWRVERISFRLANSKATTLSNEQTEELLKAIYIGTPQKPSSLRGDIGSILEALENSPNPSESDRFAVDALLQKNQSEFCSMLEAHVQYLGQRVASAAIPSIRDNFKASYEQAQEVLSRVQRLSTFAIEASREAFTRRILAAALIEVKA